MSAAVVEPSENTEFTYEVYSNISFPENISLGEGWTDISDNAFIRTALTQITIPASVTSIGENAFLGTKYLNNITVNSSNTNYSSDILGVLFDKNKTNLIQYPIANTITSYTIPSTVTSIGENSFIANTSLTQITIPSSVTIIGDSAFERIISLESVIFAHDSSLNTIGGEAFYGTTNLTSISIPSNVTNIGVNAFQQSGLTTVYMRQFTINALNASDLNANISFGSDQIFYGATGVTIINYDMLSVFVSIDNSIKDIDISGQLTSSSYVNDISTNKIKYVNIGTNVTSISGEAFQNATALTQVIIPSTVTEIGSNAFQNATNLTQVIIPSTVTTIGSNAFDGASNLTSINIPNSVTSIGSNAFLNASKLTSITVPYEVNILNEGMFQSATSLSSVYFALDTRNETFGSSKITSIGTNAFNNVSFLNQITIPATITSIGQDAFKNTSALRTLYMWPFTIATLNTNDPSLNLSDGSGQTFYGNSDFRIRTPSSTLFVQLEENNNKYIVNNIANGQLKLKSDAYTINIGSSLLNYVDIGTNVTSIIENAFQNAYVLSQITIPSSVTSIGENAFQNATALRQITIPSSVTSIGANAFQGATSLTSITIPSSVTSIGANAFQYDIALNNIIVDSSNNNYSSDISGVLFDKNKTNLIQYPIANTITSYAIPDGVTKIENYAFQGAVNLVNITLPASVTNIGSNAFLDASGLTSVIFQESTNLSKLNVNVGQMANFFDASNVSISIITQVFNGAGELTNTMTDLSGATSASIEGYTSIGSEAFKDNTTLTNVTFSSSVTSIGSKAFSGATNLPQFILPLELKSIGEEAFFGMTKLTEITLPSSINSIGKNAFQGSGLTQVYIRPSSLAALNAIDPSQNLIDGTGQTFYGKTGVSIILLGIEGAADAVVKNGEFRTFLNTVISSDITLDDISSNIIHYTNDLYKMNRVVITVSRYTLANVTEYNKQRLINIVKPVCATEFSINKNRIYVLLDDNSNTNSIIITIDILKSGVTESMVPICFPRGTRVTTDQGNVAIELLKPDIHTIRGKSIVAITQTRPIFEYIISIDKDALGKNIPSVKTEISKEHKVFYKGEMVKAKDLVELCSGVKKIPYNGETLYNVLMEKHDKMMINNLICETLDPDNIMAKICRGKCSQAVKHKIYEELNAIIKTNNVPAYKNACDYLSANL